MKAYSFIADVVLVGHAAFVVFVVLGLVLVVAGGIRRWPWVRNPWFRWLHMIAIAVVVVQSWVGLVCPLTAVENWLRERASGPVYSGGFIEHWLQSLLYYTAPSWVFTLAYTVFGMLVVAAWWFFPPRLIHGGEE